MTVPTRQEMLDAVNTAIQAKMVGGAVQSYSVNGRNLQSMPLSELMKWRDQLQKEISVSFGPADNYAGFSKI
jgi:hypothetical protein